MKTLKAGLDQLKALLEEKNPEGADALRHAEVNDLWRNAVAGVFGADAAALVLDHTNSVYVMSGEQGGNLRRFDRPRSETQGAVAGKVLAVYCDDSLVRSELDNRQELLKMKFKEQGEDVEALKILPSTRDMKNRHPFSAAATGYEPSCAPAPAARRRSLSLEERRRLEEQARHVEDPALRRALLRAMVAEAERSGAEPGSPGAPGAPGASAEPSDR